MEVSHFCQSPARAGIPCLLCAFKRTDHAILHFFPQSVRVLLVLTLLIPCNGCHHYLPISVILQLPKIVSRIYILFNKFPKPHTTALNKQYIIHHVCASIFTFSNTLLVQFILFFLYGKKMTKANKISKYYYFFIYFYFFPLFLIYLNIVYVNVVYVLNI